MKSSLLILCMLIVFLSSCRKEHAAAVNCNNIQQAILNNNQELIKSEINNICQTIPVQVSASDPDGLKYSLDELVSRLSSKCGLSVKSLCFFCIDTLPPQSEISISVTTSGGTVTKVIDISYNSSKHLHFVNMHN